MDKKRLIIYPILFTVLLAIATLGFQEFGTSGLLFPMLVTMGYVTIFFVVAQIVKDNSIIDMGWGFGFVLGSWTTLLTTSNPTLLSYVIVGFITIWGLRLTVRLVRRNWGRPEDFRYAQWRKEWGDKVVITAFFRVFMIQGIINFIVGSASYATIKFNQFDVTNWTQGIVYLGLLMAIVGLFFEVVGDEQLRQHINKGEKKLLTTGLWSLTRHPNYFGDMMIWIGLYVTGLAMLFNGSVPIVFYLVLVISPLLMSTVFMKISTPLLEKNMEKYDGWEAYKKNTPMLFPWSKS